MPTIKNAIFNRVNPNELPKVFAGLDYLGSLEVEVPTMTKLRRVRRTIGTAFNDYEEVRKEIFARHGEEKDGITRVDSTMESWTAFVSDLNKLHEETFEVTDVVTLEDIPVGTRVKERELSALGDLFVSDSS